MGARRAGVLHARLSWPALGSCCRGQQVDAAPTLETNPPFQRTDISRLQEPLATVHSLVGRDRMAARTISECPFLRSNFTPACGLLTNMRILSTHVPSVRSDCRQGVPLELFFCVYSLIGRNYG
ncbi:hypothetical protein MAPG_01767 [Magnaporthiopsis poae ATCC 64411]|uniref:Uncharacterized protein n=1 Tax=Magnaporthiopsis poae (strain ATCC 64411 / 73-15) TaxID=644358 RepID=A0A0C4DPJ9_MAGP6|nr:hypothetical protein MAPG_01767 [Magnaporthiopsis poae ATCC 64411]